MDGFQVLAPPRVAAADIAVGEGQLSRELGPQPPAHGLGGEGPPEVLGPEGCGGADAGGLRDPHHLGAEGRHYCRGRRIALDRLRLVLDSSGCRCALGDGTEDRGPRERMPSVSPASSLAEVSRIPAGCRTLRHACAHACMMLLSRVSSIDCVRVSHVECVGACVASLLTLSRWQSVVRARCPVHVVCDHDEVRCGRWSRVCLPGMVARRIRG